MEKQSRKTNTLRRVGKIFLKIMLGIFFLILLVFILILTPPVQNFISKKAVAFLEKKLQTEVSIGNVYIGLTRGVVLKNVYIEDRQKDTLLYGGRLKANLSLLQLIFKKEVDIKSIELEDITARIKRQLPDTSFNFQFIIDAFAPAPSADKTPSDTAASSFTIRSVELNRINIIYKDVVTGNDMQATLAHLATKIDRFDPEKFHFDISRLQVDGLAAKIYQSKPLVTAESPAKDSLEATEPAAMQIGLDELALTNIQLDYRNDVSALYADLDLGELNVRPKNLDLAERVIEIDKIVLDKTTAAIRLGRKEQAKLVAKEIKQEGESRAEAGWALRVVSMDLTDNNIRFDNDNMAKAAKGMDFAHLKADGLTLGINELTLTNDSISGSITKGSFREQSGFVLNGLRTDFLYSSHGAYLKELYLETPGTELKRNALIRYASIESLQKDLGNLFLDLDIADSRIHVKDILTFVPALQQQPAFANPNATWYIDSRVKGRVADLLIEKLKVEGLQDTKVDITGSISGLPAMKKMVADLEIRNISSSQRDIASFIPKGQLPANIVLPSKLNVNGRISGNTENMKARLFVATDLGNVSVEGSFGDFNDPEFIRYNARVETRSLDLGTILRQKQMLGLFSATITAKGTGFDPKTANAAFHGIVHAAVIKGYHYHDFNITGDLRDQKATVAAGITDPNIHFALDATADLSTDYPSVKLTGMIDSVKLQQLNLAKDVMIFRGKIDADFPVTNPDDLQGSLWLTQALLVQNEKRLQLDTVELSAGRKDSGHYVQLNSNLVIAKLEGQYKLTAIGYVFQQAVQPYFAIMPNTAVPTIQPYDFTFNAYVLDNPALKLFVPGLQRLDSVTVQSRFTSSNGWTASVAAPYIEIGANRVHDLQFRAGTNQDVLEATAFISRINSGTNLAINNTTLAAKVANNNIDFALNIRDSEQKDKYNLRGLLQQPQHGNYIFSLRPDSLLLNYDAWTISADNRIAINGGINAKNFLLRQNTQQISVNSIGSDPGAPMEVNFDQFRLATLAGFVQSDSTFADGLMNGKITFSDLSNEPVFTGNLDIIDLSLKGDTVGNVKMAVNNRVADTYAADIRLSGRGNDVRMAGNYYLKTGTSNFDLDLDINALPMTTAQAFSNGMIRNSSGSLNGHFDVTGTMDKPIVRGDLNFNKAAFNYAMFNSYFTIDKEKITVNESGLVFDRFEIKDSAQNALVINGKAATGNFVNYQFDMTMRANNFRALNSTKRDNRLFYGQLFFTTNLNIKGTEAAPVIDGRLVINDETRFTVVLPQQDPGVVDRDGIVEFVDMDAPLNDSLFMAAYDSLNTSSFTGMDVSLNIEVSKEAEFNLIVDEGNGDFLNVKGEALLTAGIDPSGKINLAGSYELEQGSYELSFNFLRRKFDIEKGSRIVWEGEPTDATVDIKAVYTANAAPLDLVKNQLEEASAYQRNTYLQRLPFDVHLAMEGELLRPEISFDIILPEEKKYAVAGDIITTVRTRLDQLRQEPGEMNKQVFSLLLLNRFVADNPFESSGSGFNAGAFARQSVSKLLTEQLNRLAGDLVAGVDLNFDVLSSEDYTTGERRDRTDLNVGLSKQLLNDRLKVTIGSNFELEGPSGSNQQSTNIAGDVAVDYSVSRDNRYLLRGYRKNEYQGVIDGYIIETGLSFIITVDYNRFREIFMSKRERDQRRQRRQQQRQSERQPDSSQNAQLPVDSIPATN